MQTQHSLQAQEQDTRPRNPFDSPSLSVVSFNETDDGGSTSGQDEFHLERYSSNAKYGHARQPSTSQDGVDRDRKPHLNIITNLAGPKMPMKAETVVISEIAAKQAKHSRKAKALSIVSHRAVSATTSPPDQDMPSPRVHNPNSKRTGLSKVSKRINAVHRLQKAVAHKQPSPLTQRIPIGITIPQQDAARLHEAITDSALPSTTPVTPAIVVTPAGAQRPWILQQRNANESHRPASSIYSAMPVEKALDHSKPPPLPRATHSFNEKNELDDPRASCESSEPVLFGSADADRPKSQGWWNLMLSPLLRNSSIASRRAKPVGTTPPVPPLPFAAEKQDSPALSMRSDPSFLVSPDDTSPDTPRRQGLASARASTWSRWTEWEQEREVNGQKDVLSEKDLSLGTDSGRNLSGTSHTSRPGLAAEYYHACAIEQLTSRPYFECINHSCKENLLRLQTLYDGQNARRAVLGSPFESPLTQSKSLGDKGVEHHDREQMSPSEVSPVVGKASIAPVVKAKALDSASDKETGTSSTRGVQIEHIQDKALAPASEPTIATNPPANTHSASRTNDPLPNIAAIAPPPSVIEIKVSREDRAHVIDTTMPSEKAPITQPGLVSSPGPISPEGEKSMAPTGAVPLYEVEKQPQSSNPIVFKNYLHNDQLPQRPAFINAETEYPPLPDRQPTAPVTADDLEDRSRKLSIERTRKRHEREDAAAQKVGGLWRGRGCFPKNGCMGRGGPEKRTRRRWVIGVSLLLLAIIITCIVLAVTLTRHGDGTPVNSQWLNLTGFPPMPTGILTIAAPNLAASQKQCVKPTTMWSCSVPKEDRGQLGTNDPDQPNFRFEIKFRNGTVPSNMTIPLRSGKDKLKKRVNDPFTNDLFVPNPQPPNQPDQVFLGQTTDNITAPFDGEKTPFFITFMSTFPAVPSAFNNSGGTSTKRPSRRDTNSSLTNALPAPALADDGSAAPASLLPVDPFPVSQPVRLYNRGQRDEHYGFYMYYDKSIYLSGIQLNGTSVVSSDDPEADQDGGSTKSQASVRCTFAQTRFLFKVFTNPSFASLLPSAVNANLTAPDDARNQKHNTLSSATNFNRPGSFPFPTSIILDRHGGDIDSKVAYCYGMSNGQIVKDSKVVVGELRGFGGTIVNPAPTVLQNQGDFNKTAGGIDGGTGGCGCTWQNWQ